MAQLLNKTRSDNRGGYRKNSGRKKSENKAFQIRCKPENIEIVRNFIKENRL